MDVGGLNPGSRKSRSSERRDATGLSGAYKGATQNHAFTLTDPQTRHAGICDPSSKEGPRVRLQGATAAQKKLETGGRHIHGSERSEEPGREVEAAS